PLLSVRFKFRNHPSGHPTRYCSFAGISWTSSGSPEFLKACRSSGSRDGVSAIERVP
ncbi:hypothetical protein LINPERHAP1_LOCUS14237, partial [Linum perenne]